MAFANAIGVLDRWGAVLSHRSAASLWGLLPWQAGVVDVSVRGVGGRGERRGIHLHRSRTLGPELTTTHRGIPVTTPARTILDLQRGQTTRGCPAGFAGARLRQAIRQAEVLGLATGAEHLTEGTRSDLELAFLKICRRHGIPAPAVNTRIASHQVDFLWRGQGLIVETDGYRYHRGRSAFEADRDRDLRLRALGFEVIRLSERQIKAESGPVAEVLHKALGSRSGVSSVSEEAVG